MNTHKWEESDVLLEGDIIYAFSDTTFTIEGPYRVNIQPIVLYAFKKIGSKTANLVAIPPSNVWKYEVAVYFTFEKW